MTTIGMIIPNMWCFVYEVEQIDYKDFDLANSLWESKKIIFKIFTIYAIMIKLWLTILLPLLMIKMLLLCYNSHQ